jgi:threonine/homoserine/homoserine lactone efflux protein
MSLFLKGLIVGFCLAAPVGPIAALCVQRTISKRLISGLTSGLGAAAADAFYGAVAAFGATIISEFLIAERSWMQRVGGVILIFMGLRLFLAKPVGKGRDQEVAEGAHGSKGEVRASKDANGRGLAGDFLSTFLLTLTNPMTFVAFAAVFTTMGIGAVRGRPFLTAELVVGVLLGSQLWWTILCGGAHALRRHFDYRKLTTINRATGIFVIGVGLVYLLIGSESAREVVRPSADRRVSSPASSPLSPL